MVFVRILRHVLGRNPGVLLEVSRFLRDKYVLDAEDVPLILGGKLVLMVSYSKFLSLVVN